MFKKIFKFNVIYINDKELTFKKIDLSSRNYWEKDSLKRVKIIFFRGTDRKTTFTGRPMPRTQHDKNCHVPILLLDFTFFQLFILA